MFKRITLTVLALGAGLAALPTVAQADPPWAREWDHRGRWEHDRYERDRWRDERWERQRAYERQAYRPGYYAPPPIYYAPPPRPVYPPPYVAPGASLYVPFR